MQTESLKDRAPTQAVKKADSKRARELPPEISDELTNLSDSQAGLISEDLATFFIVHQTTHGAAETVDELKRYFQGTPELLELVDPILSRMEQEGMIEIERGSIRVLSQFLELGGDVEAMKRFLPNLMKSASNRVLDDARDAKSFRKKKEVLHYFTLPDDPETSSEALALFVEYKLKMLALADRAKTRRGQGTRLVGVVNCSLVPEDFV